MSLSKSQLKFNEERRHCLRDRPSAPPPSSHCGDSRHSLVDLRATKGVVSTQRRSPEGERYFRGGVCASKGVGEILLTFQANPNARMVRCSTWSFLSFQRCMRRRRRVPQAKPYCRVRGANRSAVLLLSSLCSISIPIQWSNQIRI